MYKGIFIMTVLFLTSCKQDKIVVSQKHNRYFSDESFWNQKIQENPEIDERSDYWISLLQKDSYKSNFGPNVEGYTIPIYEVDSTTPLHTVLEREFTDEQWAVVGFEGKWFDKGEKFHHQNNFGTNVPIPSIAVPDGESDAHMALVDYDRKIAWDMWGAKYEDGQWYSYTGMKYSLDGDGVFDTENFNIEDDHSVHHYGPGTASGIPVIAGTIMHHEVVEAKKIEHKISGAVRYTALKEYVYPAIWTDGIFEGGIPEGAVIQLNPDLNLSQFNLTEGELTVAKAIQEYGLVIRDVALGNVIYPEGLENHKDKSWSGVLRGWSEEGGIKTIPLTEYRVLKVENVIKKGDNARPAFHHLL